MIKQPKWWKFFLEHFCWVGLMAGFVIGVICGIFLGLPFPGSGMGYLCGPYGNKYIPSICEIKDYGHNEIYGRNYDQETNTWKDIVVDLEYYLKIKVTTIIEPEYNGVTTIMFEDEEELDQIIQRYNLEVNQTMGCNIINKIVEDDPKGSTLDDGWDDHKLTLDEDPQCPYLYIYIFAPIGGCIFLTLVISLVIATKEYLKERQKYMQQHELQHYGSKFKSNSKSSSAIQSKRRRKSKRAKGSDVNQNLCLICHEEFSESDPKITKDIKQLSCGHRFHKDCYVEWKKKSNTCPYCRKKQFL